MLGLAPVLTTISIKTLLYANIWLELNDRFLVRADKEYIRNTQVLLKTSQGQ